MDRQARTKSGSECTERKTIFDSQPELLSCRAASMPLRIGMEISVTMTSGFSRIAASIRERPLETLPMTLKAGSNTLAARYGKPGWSSPSNILILFNGSACCIRREEQKLAHNSRPFGPVPFSNSCIAPEFLQPPAQYPTELTLTAANFDSGHNLTRDQGAKSSCDIISAGGGARHQSVFLPLKTKIPRALVQAICSEPR
jgi:hypothetical protein